MARILLSLENILLSLNLSMHLRYFYKPLSFPIIVFCIAMFAWSLLRSFLYFSIPSQAFTFLEVTKVFGLGLWFDLATLAYLIAPLLLLSVLIPNSLRNKKIYQHIVWLVLGIIIFTIIFGLVSEYIFWQEFRTRFNFIAVDYLIYTHEVIGNIRESYPISAILIALAILSFAIVLLMRRLVSLKMTMISRAGRLKFAAIGFLLPICSALFVNIDQAASQFTNVYAQELSMNGLFSLASAMKRNDLDYERFYSTMNKAKAKKLLMSLRGDPSSINLFGHSNLDAPFIKRPKNIVMITVESLSAEYLGAYGSLSGVSPKLDEIAKQGLVFDRLYATGTRTVRGLEALSLGTPPIPGQAIVRRPNNQHLSTIGEYLEQQGVSTVFVYGGYGYFDNMAAYFGANDYKVFDRTNFDSKSIAMENIWGVADESLFDNTLDIIDKTAANTKPFFVQIMTTSNHRPYTFPDGKIDLPQGSRLAAVKYSDYAIGRFLAQAKNKPWFDDTLFLIVADHCASVAGKTKLPVAKYHIPMIFYGPKIVKPNRFRPIISQIDIPPTLLDLLGFQGAEKFFGQNFFQVKNIEERAFISNYQSLGYYKNNQLVVLLPKQKIETYQIDPKTFEAKKSKPDKTLIDEAIAYYQTAAVDFKLGLLKESPLK